MCATLNYTRVAIIGLSSLFFLASCDDSVFPVAEHGCDWVDDSIAVQFVNAEFYSPKEDCVYPFYNHDWAYESPIIGVYNLLYAISGEMYSHSFKMTWITSIESKRCDAIDNDINNRRIQLDENDYSSYLYPSDLIEASPLVSSTCGFSSQDYKHQLIIQVPDVANEADNSFGTVTWEYVWLAEEDATFVNPLWTFLCPTNGFPATYTPNYGYTRNIYVYNHFEDVL